MNLRESRLIKANRVGRLGDEVAGRMGRGARDAVETSSGTKCETLASEITSDNFTYTVHFLRRHFLRTSQAILALMLAGLVLFLDAMAVCPSLHELIHKDADSPDHQCAVTLFAHGQVDSTVVEVAPIVLTPPIETVSPVFLPVFASCLQYLPSGRAPPFRSVVA